MRSSWGYFSEIRCFAERLVMTGNVSFKVFNSFEDRIYIEQFSLIGGYIAYPFSQSLRKDIFRIQMQQYISANYISPVEVILSMPGLIWATLVLVSTTILIRRENEDKAE